MAAALPPPPPPPPPLDFSETPSPISASSPVPLEAPGSSLLTTAESFAPSDRTASAPVVELDIKLWERAWSLEELRTGSQQWTLASDAGLLLYLQGFSQRLTSRTHEIEKQVDGLVQETDASQTRVQNTFNEFLMLANTQFVESRVYDEEERREDTEKAKKDEPEKTREQIETEVIPRITSALQFGLNVLENAFDKIEVPEDERSSDEEGEDEARSASAPEPILEPKDPYIVRPLPHLIGSVKFLQDDDVGIGEPESEDEEDEAKSETVSTMSESEASTEEEEGSEVEKKPKKTKKRKDSDSSDALFRVGSDSETSTSESGISDESASDKELEEESDNELKPKVAAGHDFTAELAARIGAAIPAPAKDSDEEGEPFDEDDDSKAEAEVAKPVTKKDKHKKKKKKKEKEEEGKSKGSGGLFDKPEDDVFDAKDGLFSTKGGGLFSGSDEDEGSLFDDKPKKAPEPAKAEPSPSTRKKPPPGAVPVFGGNLFGKEEPVVEEAPAPVVKTAPAPVVKTAPAPVVKKSATGGGGGLFSSEEEDDDIFSTTSKPNQTKPSVVEDQPKTPSGLFDADDRGDLFNANEPSKPVEVKQAKKAKKKPPVGGVSLFGGMLSPEGDEEDDLFSTMPSQSVAAASKSPAASKPTTSTAGLSSSLFDDDDDDDDMHNDIFPIKSNTVEKPAPVKDTPPQESTVAKKKPVGGVSLFGGADLFGKSTKDEEPKPQKQIEPEKPKAGPSIDIEKDNEDDLFSAQPKPAKQTAQPASTVTGGIGGGLFDDDDENDLFAVKPAPQKESAKKKPTGGVSLFGGKDLFGTKDKPSKANVGEKKSVERGPLLGDEDEDDLFSSSARPTPKTKEKTVDRGPLAGSKGEDDLFAEPSRPKPKAEQKPVQKGPLGLDDDDDLFASPPTAKIKVEEKPKPVERGPLDFESDENALFSPGKQKSQPAPSQPVMKAPNVTVTSKSSKPAEIHASPKPAPAAVSKATVGGLFGDDDDDDDDLFAPKKPSPQPVQSSPQPQKKKPVGGVSLFGGADLFNKPKGPTPAESERREQVEKLHTEQKRQPEPKTIPKTGGGLFDDDDDDDLFAPVKPTPSAKAAPPSQPSSKKPVGGVSLFGGANLFDKPVEKEEVPKPKEEPKKPKGLFDNSKIDEDLFASEPVPVVKSPVLGKIGLAINPAALLPGARPPMKQVEEKSVNFDAPVEVNTLDTMTKNRPRGQARRPPSRRHRQGSSTPSESSSVLTPKSPPVSSFSPPPVTTSAEDDLFGIPTAVPTTRKSPTPTNDSIFDLSIRLEPNTPNQDDDDDIFATKTPSQVKSKGTVPVVNEEDLGFPVAAAAVTAPEEDLFADIEKVTKKPVKFSGPSDAELFGDTGGIFADVPSKPKATTKKTTKKKKIQKESSPAVPDQLEGSIFDQDPVAKPKKKVVKKAGSAKKSTKQQAASIFDDDAPSIFDDPSAGAK